MRSTREDLCKPAAWAACLALAAASVWGVWAHPCACVASATGSGNNGSDPSPHLMRHVDALGDVMRILWREQIFREEQVCNQLDLADRWVLDQAHKIWRRVSNNTRVEQQSPGRPLFTCGELTYLEWNCLTAGRYATLQKLPPSHLLCLRLHTSFLLGNSCCWLRGTQGNMCCCAAMPPRFAEHHLLAARAFGRQYACWWPYPTSVVLLLL